VITGLPKWYPFWLQPTDGRIRSSSTFPINGTGHFTRNTRMVKPWDEERVKSGKYCVPATIPVITNAFEENSPPSLTLLPRILSRDLSSRGTVAGNEPSDRILRLPILWLMPVEKGYGAIRSRSETPESGFRLFQRNT
jgi:hypothetical protein